MENSSPNVNNPTEENFNRCKKVMMKAPPLMKMFDLKDIIAGAAVMYIPWTIVLLIVFIISII